MFTERVGNLYLSRLRPLKFRIPEGFAINNYAIIDELAIQFSPESCKLLKLDYDDIMEMVIEKPDYIIRGHYVPTLPTYNDDGEIEDVKPLNSFIIDNKGPHVLFVTGLPLTADEDQHLIRLDGPDVIFKNSFSDQQKKLIYYITH